MKDLRSLAGNIRDSNLKNLLMEVAQFIFSQSQENLVKPMPWGDDKYPANKRPTMISNEGILLQSGVAPYWKDGNTIEFRYDAPTSIYVEYGCGPHPVAAYRLQDWVRKKLGIRGKENLRVAFAISNKIRTEGMPPHPFIRPALLAGERKYKMVKLNVGFG
jgi:hypothetical protein